MYSSKHNFSTFNGLCHLHSISGMVEDHNNIIDVNVIYSFLSSLSREVVVLSFKSMGLALLMMEVLPLWLLYLLGEFPARM